MPNNFRFRRNAFQETMLGLEYQLLPGHTIDLFSQACVLSYTGADWSQFGYLFTQIFEPSVLEEIALLEGISYDALIDLSYQPNLTINRFAELFKAAEDLPVVGVVNLSSALISISRFNVAAEVLTTLFKRAISAREIFEIAWLQFLISNRCNRGQDSPTAFAKMIETIETGSIPQGRILDVCTQAVVWYLKRREVPEDIFKWALTLGHRLSKTPERIGPGAVSSWYRGLAMLPAAKGKTVETRKYMQRARDAAERTISQQPGPYELNTIKTYYESTMKEHMYVTKNFGAAEEAGLALLALDGAWSPSYGELAEVYDFFGHVDQAAKYYEEAIDIGPPYVRHHLLRAGRCRARIGDHEMALSHYLSLVGLAPQKKEILLEGFNIAQQMDHTSQSFFENKLQHVNLDQ